MKLVDSKGKIFGKINLLDLVIFVIILGLLYGIVSSLHIFSKKEMVTYKWVELKIKCSDVLNEVVGVIKPNFQIMENLKKL